MPADRIRRVGENAYFVPSYSSQTIMRNYDPTTTVGVIAATDDLEDVPDVEVIEQNGDLAKT